MTDITPENVARIASDCRLAAKVMANLDIFETGQGILAESADMLEALSARLAEVEALIAAALMEAAEAVDEVQFNDAWGDETPAERIRTLISLDAMASLDAYRDREVTKALERALDLCGTLDNAAECWVTIRAMIPQMKS